MDSLIAKIGAGVIGLAVIVGGKYYMGTSRRADASKEVLVACQAMIQEVPGYKQDPGYMDWLVKEGHQAVFNDSYSIDNGSRRRAGQDTVDLDHYFDDLFAWMIGRAKSDGRTQVAESLEKYQADPDAAVEEEVKKKNAPAENPFLKKPK